MMPIYEYHCKPCDREFETIVRGASDVPRCPSCGESEGLAKRFSVPASAQTGGSSGLPIAAGNGDGPAFGCGAGGCGSGMCEM